MPTILNLQLLYAFIPTFFVVSITPGMCMTLSMSLGITIGVRRTLWMMIGELAGVGLVATAAVVGAAALMLNYPTVFTVFRYVGGLYLMYLGVRMWLSRGKTAVAPEAGGPGGSSRLHLVAQGFVTAVANPKGWAFFIVLLPPFIDSRLPMAPQLGALISLILVLEFLCLLLYANGGRGLNRILRRSGNVRTLNRISGTLMMAVGVWLALG